MRKYKNSAFDLPEEFYVLDMSRFHYVVVAGRRTDFRDKTYIIKRERKKADDIDIIHYDNLFDFSNNLLSVKLDAPAPCRLDAPDLDLICYASADCLHQHLQVI